MPVSNRTTRSAKEQRKYERNREYARRGMQKYLERGGCIACGSVREDENVQHCNKCRDRRRSATLRRLYKVTLEEYEELAALQNWVCWICKGKVTSKKGNLLVDHSHKTGKTRGLLCTKCNAGIGGLCDSIEMLERAIEYLREFGE